MGLIFLFAFILFLIPIGVAIFTLISFWYIYKKAGKEGWESIVPVYNIIVLLEITGLPMWYIALLFVPFGNIYALIRIYLELGYRFKQSTGFGVGLIFLPPIFLGILAFNKNIIYASPQIITNAFCSKCGNKVNDDDKFCTNCGEKIDRPKDICLNCGNKLKKDDKFCTHCGTKV